MFHYESPAKTAWTCHLAAEEGIEIWTAGTNTLGGGQDANNSSSSPSSIVNPFSAMLFM
jgi:hypothetical protein